MSRNRLILIASLYWLLMLVRYLGCPLQPSSKLWTILRWHRERRRRQMPLAPLVLYCASCYCKTMRRLWAVVKSKKTKTKVKVFLLKARYTKSVASWLFWVNFNDEIQYSSSYFVYFTQKYVHFRNIFNASNITKPPRRYDLRRRRWYEVFSPMTLTSGRPQKKKQEPAQ